MMYLMQAGGHSMWLVLLFGILTLGAATMFAFRPEDNRLGFVRGMTLATVFVVLGGTADALAATFRKVVETPDWHQGSDIALVPMAGISESMSAAILGSSMLGLAWLITAAGCLRRPSTHS